MKCYLSGSKGLKGRTGYFFILLLGAIGGCQGGGGGDSASDSSQSPKDSPTQLAPPPGPVASTRPDLMPEEEEDVLPPDSKVSKAPSPHPSPTPQQAPDPEEERDSSLFHSPIERESVDGDKALNEVPFHKVTGKFLNKTFTLKEAGCVLPGSSSLSSLEGIRTLHPLWLIFSRNFFSDEKWGEISTASTGTTTALSTATSLIQGKLNQPAASPPPSETSSSSSTKDVLKGVGKGLLGTAALVGGGIGESFAKEALGKTAAQKRYEDWGQGVTLSRVSFVWMSKEVKLQFFDSLQKAHEVSQKISIGSSYDLGNQLSTPLGQGSTPQNIPFGICYGDSLCLEIPSVKDPKICTGGRLFFKWTPKESE